jgi:hypothetical protein
MADEPNDAQHTAKKFLEDAREQIRPRLEGLVAHTAEAARQLAADMGEAPTPDNRRYWGTMGNFLTFGGQRLNSGSPELHALHAAKRRGHDPREPPATEPPTTAPASEAQRAAWRARRAELHRELADQDAEIRRQKAIIAFLRQYEAPNEGGMSS